MDKIWLNKQKQIMNNIVIVGGGTAGWLSALYLNDKFKNSNITLIESDEIGILGAGEGSTANLKTILNELGITDNDLIENCDATFKVGIDFENWTNENDSYFHPLQYNKLGKIPIHAFHFNARLFAKYLKKVSLERGVIWVEGIVEKPITNDNDEIVGLKVGETIVTSDFVIDCTGFRRLLIGNHYKSKWKSYSEHLKVNAAIPFFIHENTNELYTKTRSIAMNHGWMWQIPLQTRKGCGYIFDMNEITEEEAKQEVIKFLGHNVEFNKLIKFEPGCYEKVWIKNCIAIGLSGGFLEPLEATSIMTTVIQLIVFYNMTMKNKTPENYNDLVHEVNNQNMLFIYYHYFGNKDTTFFWKKVMESRKNKPKRLLDIIDNQDNIKSDIKINEVWKFLEIFPIDAWNIINNGIKNRKLITDGKNLL